MINVLHFFFWNFLMVALLIYYSFPGGFLGPDSCHQDVSENSWCGLGNQVSTRLCDLLFIDYLALFCSVFCFWFVFALFFVLSLLFAYSFSSPIFFFPLCLSLTRTHAKQTEDRQLFGSDFEACVGRADDGRTLDARFYQQSPRVQARWVRE